MGDFTPVLSAIYHSRPSARIANSFSLLALASTALPHSFGPNLNQREPRPEEVVRWEWRRQ